MCNSKHGYQYRNFIYINIYIVLYFYWLFVECKTYNDRPLTQELQNVFPFGCPESTNPDKSQLQQSLLTTICMKWISD